MLVLQTPCRRLTRYKLTSPNRFVKAVRRSDGFIMLQSCRSLFLVDHLLVNGRILHHTLQSLPRLLARLCAVLECRGRGPSSSLQISSPQAGADCVCECEEDSSNRHQLQQVRNNAETRVWTTVLFDKFVTLRRVPALQLKVAGMRSRAGTATLEDDVHGSTNERYGVQTTVDE